MPLRTGAGDPHCGAGGVECGCNARAASARRGYPRKHDTHHSRSSPLASYVDCASRWLYACYTCELLVRKVDIRVLNVQVVFDKTGTLTQGSPSVSDVQYCGAVGNGQSGREQQAVGVSNEQEMLALAAAVEEPSMHPLAKAVVAEGDRRKLPKRQLEEGSLLQVGSQTWVANCMDVHIPSHSVQLILLLHTYSLLRLFAIQPKSLQVRASTFPALSVDTSCVKNGRCYV